DRGSITVSTLQGQLGASIASIGPEPTVVEYGGLGKRMALYRLPAAGAGPREYAFSLPLDSLRPGDNPIYVRVVQEDGHMAWSSPVYLVRE
ncbi:MAG: DUF3604 domain-containing protein, partial [Bacillota bacterium]|nr:DUF3604 domain-containing protein [Bacillota bacterium]